MTIVNGRILPPPNGRVGRLGPGEWICQSFDFPAYSNQQLDWGIFAVPGDNYSDRDLSKLTRDLMKDAQTFGLQFNTPKISRSCRQSDLEQHFKYLIDHNCHFAVFILYGEFDYAEIKRLSDLHLGLPTQCVRNITLRKPRVVANLLLKLNGKLRGINWSIPRLSHELTQTDELIMVLGADVTHPSPTQKNQLPKSIAAVTGSMNKDLTRYSAVVRMQSRTSRGNKSTREIIDNLDLMVEFLIKRLLRNTNGQFPTKLIFYRDGVSEGQFEIVLVQELGAIQQACLNIRPDWRPGITYIVVQKRHHIRFQRQDNGSFNVDPGTVVDTEVTHPREFDFYLCSQKGIQGTSKPAHYHVLYDDNGFGSDCLQLFTYFLCHVYMRCPRSVSYPAPTYYAHLAAFRGRTWMQDIQDMAGIVQDDLFDVHENQIESMFFL